MERCFALHPNRRNPYAHALLVGDMRPPADGPALRQIEVRCADATDFLERQPPGSFTGFSLSNILDGTNAAYARRLLAAVQRAAAPQATVVLRSFHQPECVTETNHAAEDRSMLWGIVDVRPAAAAASGDFQPIFAHARLNRPAACSRCKKSPGVSTTSP